MKPEINLLPKWAREAKARRSLIKTLGTVQAAIVVLLIVAVFLLNLRENRASLRVAELNAKIHEIGTSPAETARQLQRAHAEAAYVEEFFAALDDGIGGALYLLQAATPENATLTRVDFDQGEFLIASQTSDQAGAEAHRANLAYHFTYVHMGRITRTAYGYTYEIRVRP